MNLPGFQGPIPPSKFPGLAMFEKEGIRGPRGPLDENPQDWKNPRFKELIVMITMITQGNTKKIIRSYPCMNASAHKAVMKARDAGQSLIKLAYDAELDTFTVHIGYPIETFRGTSRAILNDGSVMDL